MATTIHLPKDVLARIDSRAKALGISRNRFILQAVEGQLASTKSWSPELVALLTTPPPKAVAEAADEMFDIIHSERRNRRKPPKL